MERPKRPGSTWSYEQPVTTHANRRSVGTSQRLI
jgi:hypothetical protein